MLASVHVHFQVLSPWHGPGPIAMSSLISISGPLIAVPCFCFLLLLLGSSQVGPWLWSHDSNAVTLVPCFCFLHWSSFYLYDSYSVFCCCFWACHIGPITPCPLLWAHHCMTVTVGPWIRCCDSGAMFLFPSYWISFYLYDSYSVFWCCFWACHIVPVTSGECHIRPIITGPWLWCCVSCAMFLFPSFKFILFIWFLLLLLLLFPGPWHCDTGPVTPYCVLLPWVVCWQVFTLPTLMCLPTVERWSRQVLWQVWGASDSTFYYDEEFRVHDEPDGSGVRKLVVLSKREHG